MDYSIHSLFITILCSTAMTASAEGYNSDLEDKVELFSFKIAKLEEENLDLQRRLSESEMNNYLAFDCFLNDSWETNGIITFAGCSGIEFSILTIICNTSRNSIVVFMT